MSLRSVEVWQLHHKRVSVSVTVPVPVTTALGLLGACAVWPNKLNLGQDGGQANSGTLRHPEWYSRQTPLDNKGRLNWFSSVWCAIGWYNKRVPPSVNNYSELLVALIAVAMLSKASVCGRSLPGVVGSNTAGGHGCLSVVSDVCCQVELSASGWSLIQSSPTYSDASGCDREASIMRRPWPTGGLLAH